MDNLRYKVERDTLSRHLPEDSFCFHDINTDKPYLEVIVTTVTDNQYLLYIDLEHYPESKPDVYIQSFCPYNSSSWEDADLDDYQGNSLKNVSAANHTLSPHPDNDWIQICHYNPNAWRPDDSLYIVFLKCNYWLNAYEYSILKHIPMNEVMKHQNDDDIY